jgi:hypothetical protein
VLRYRPESPIAIARAAWYMAYLYRDFGNIGQAHQVVMTLCAISMRHLVRVASCCGSAAWCSWLRRGTHAREYRPALAWRAWDAAVEAKSRSGMSDPPDVLFGATVEDVALALDVELGRSASATRRAEAIDLRSVASTPRRARLAIEAARALMLRREYAGALHMLHRAYSLLCISCLRGGRRRRPGQQLNRATAARRTARQGLADRSDQGQQRERTVRRHIPRHSGTQWTGLVHGSTFSGLP